MDITGIAVRLVRPIGEPGVPADPSMVQSVQVSIGTLARGRRAGSSRWTPRVPSATTSTWLVTDEHAPAWWVLADPEGDEACVATTKGRD